MNILYIEYFFVGKWFLRYREFPYSCTVRIGLLSPTWFLDVGILR